MSSSPDRIVKIDSQSLVDPGPTVSMRCPACRQQGTLERVSVADVRTHAPIDGVFTGQRRCPNPSCHAQVFVVLKDNRLFVSYPPETVDFDSSNVPTKVVAALEEAITCHADRCFVAAAIMVRKTLEEICRDRGATGSSLHERLRALGTKVILPPELLAGLDALRLLGNDAAHFESRVFDDVGQDEVELALAVTKEVIKGVYQYGALIQRLEALKRKSQP